LDLAAAVLAVIDHDACVLTSDGKAYSDGGDLPAIVFPS
jgi:enoyl-CoA hydratase/carnithine racemase